MYKKIHIPAYTNFGSFLCGLIGGVLFDKYKHEQVELRKFNVCTGLIILYGFQYNNKYIFYKVLVSIWYSAVPVCVTMLLSGYIFYTYEFAKPAMWIAFYASTIKNLFGLYIAAFITGTAFGIGCKQ